MEEVVLTAIVDAVFSYIFENYGSKLTVLVRERLGKSPIQKAFGEALKETFKQFQERYPLWIDRLFDLSFFQSEGASVLAQFLVPDGNPQPSELAERWATSLNIQQGEARSVYISELKPIAADFLDILSHHLKCKDGLRELNNQRSFEQLVQHTRAIRHSMEADKVTPDTCRDYLHWLIQRNLYIDSRGTLQTQRQVQLKLDEVYISLKGQREEPASLVDRRILDSEKSGTRSKGLLTGLLRNTQSQPVQTHDSTISEEHDLLQIANHIERVAILGDPGSGKTTLLRYLALHHARALLSGPTESDKKSGQVYFPIMVRIADYAEHGIPKGIPFSDFLADYCRMHECPKRGLSNLLEIQLQQGHCLLLLDGLDEIVSADVRRKVVRQIEDFVHRHSKNRSNHFIITSRIAGYRNAPLGEPFAHYVIQEMQEEQIQRFLERWCKAVEDAQTPEASIEERARVTRREINGIMDALRDSPGVRRLAANPLLLRILALIHRNGAHLPHRRVELYELASETLARTWRIATGTPESALVNDEYLTPLLSKLAYWLHTNKSTGMATKQEVYQILGEEWAKLNDLPWNPQHSNLKIREEVDKFLVTVREQTGLFVERAPEQYGFMHLTFEEYYTARYLINLSETRAQLIRQHLHDPRWDEPILLALAFVGKQSAEETTVLLSTAILAQGDKAVQLGFQPSQYEELLGRDYLFALLCLGDQIPLHLKLVKQLMKRLCDELLHQTGCARFQRYRQALIERLEYLKSSRGATELASLLAMVVNNANPEVRLRAVTYLGYIGSSSSQESTTAILQAMQDSDPRVRSKAIECVERWELASHETMTSLLHTLFDTNHRVRFQAAVSLGPLENFSNDVVGTLLLKLKDTEPKTRLSIIEYVRHIKQPSAALVDLVSQLANDSDPYVRCAVIKNIQYLPLPPQSIEHILVDALYDDIARVRAVAVNNLCYLKQVSIEKVLAVLIKFLLTDKHASVRFAAVESLRSLKHFSDGVLAAFLKALDDTDSQVRAITAETLGDVPLATLPSELEQIIIKMLSVTMGDPDYKVGCNAAMSLLSLNIIRPEVFQTLIQARLKAAPFEDLGIKRCLKKVGPLSSHAALVLLSLMKEINDHSTQKIIFEFLGDLNDSSPQIMDVLVKSINDPDIALRIAVVVSLGTLSLATPEVLATLSEALNDTNQIVNEVQDLNDADPAVLNPILELRYQIAVSLAQLSQNLSEFTEDLLRNALRSSQSWHIRRESANLIGQIGQCATSASAILIGLKDKDHKVRTTCVEALVQLAQRLSVETESIAASLEQLVKGPGSVQLSSTNRSVQDYAFDSLWQIVNGGVLKEDTSSRIYQRKQSSLARGGATRIITQRI